MRSNQEYAYECLTLTAEPKMQGATSQQVYHTSISTMSHDFKHADTI